MNYAIQIAVFFEIYAVAALSLNIVCGYCGLLTMAHASFFAIGAYSYALLTLRSGMDFSLALLCSLTIAALSSLIISLPAWKFKGDFFVMMSLAAQTLIYTLLYNWHDPAKPVGTLANLTSGPFGISGVKKPAILGFVFDSAGSMAVLYLVILLISSCLVWLMVVSPWGKLLKAIRDDELAARQLGKNTKLIKLQAFALSCGLVGVAGAMYAAYVTYIEPGIASIDESLLMLCMVLVGGSGNFRGPLVGALLLLLIPELLRMLAMPDTVAANCRLILYGAALVLMMHLRPNGLAGDYKPS